MGNHPLVGGFNDLEKYEFVKMTSHILWKIKFMFEATNQVMFAD